MPLSRDDRLFPLPVTFTEEDVLPLLVVCLELVLFRPSVLQQLSLELELLLEELLELEEESFELLSFFSKAKSGEGIFSLFGGSTTSMFRYNSDLSSAVRIEGVSFLRDEELGFSLTILSLE